LKYFQIAQAVNLKDINSSKFEQTITALNFNHICEELDSEDFKEEFCKCKDFLVEISNGNILGDVVQEWLHDFKVLIL
jgi:hypothetical protein